MWSGICSVATTWIGFWTWIWSMRHHGLGQEVACWFQCWENSTCLVWQSDNTGSVDVKMDETVLEEKSSFKMLGLTFFSKLDWNSYISSIAKTASRKIGAIICSMKFLSPDLALYLCKSTIWPCMKYCCDVRATSTSSCYLELKKTFSPFLWMGFSCLKARTTSRRQFTFYH